MSSSKRPKVLRPKSSTPTGGKAYKEIYKLSAKSSMGVFILECPECEMVVASASELDWLPEYSRCGNPQCSH